LSATDIPRDRTDVLHVLRLHGDDLNELSPTQIAALRKIYRLDDDRSVEELLAAGEISMPSTRDWVAAAAERRRESWHSPATITSYPPVASTRECEEKTAGDHQP